jgi:hypothetical protein
LNQRVIAFFRKRRRYPVLNFCVIFSAGLHRNYTNDLEHRQWRRAGPGLGSRDLIRERQREGIAIAKAKGVYKGWGRKPSGR